MKETLEKPEEAQALQQGLLEKWTPGTVSKQAQTLQRRPVFVLQLEVAAPGGQALLSGSRILS